MSICPANRTVPSFHDWVYLFRFKIYLGQKLKDMYMYQRHSYTLPSTLFYFVDLKSNFRQQNGRTIKVVGAEDKLLPQT